MEHAVDPRPCRTPNNCRQHYSAENAAVVPGLEDLSGYRTHHRSQAVPKRPLGYHHCPQQDCGRGVSEQDQRKATQRKAEITDRPYPFAADPVRKVAECDLAGDRYEANQSQCPRRLGRPKADLDQIFRLVNLNCVPREEAAEVAAGDPPESGCAQCPTEGPINSGPDVVHHVLGWPCGSSLRCEAIWLETEVLGLALEQQIQGYQHSKHQHPEGPASHTPARAGNQRL